MAKKRLRDESNPEGREIWKAVELAASRAPQWIKDALDRQADLRAALDLVALYFECEGTEKAPERQCDRCGDLIRWAGSPDDYVICRSCLNQAVKEGLHRG